MYIRFICFQHIVQELLVVTVLACLILDLLSTAHATSAMDIVAAVMDIRMLVVMILWSSTTYLPLTNITA